MLINISTYFKKYLLLFIRSTQIGLEPTTFAVTGRRSNQLSHWAFKGYTLKTDTENNLYIMFLRNKICFDLAIDLLVTFS